MPPLDNTSLRYLGQPQTFSITFTIILGWAGQTFHAKALTETNLYSFGSLPDGSNPRAGLVQGSDRSFYGMTQSGGTGPKGTVFKLLTSLNSPSNQITQIHLAATNVIFDITSVAGQTYQMQSLTNLASGAWLNVPGVSVTNSIGALLTLTNFGGTIGQQRFYRFAIIP